MTKLGISAIPFLLALAFGCASSPKFFRDEACLTELKTLSEQHRKSEILQGKFPKTASNRDGGVGLKRDQVSEVINQSFEDIKGCYDQHFKNESGKMMVDFLINPDGKVEKACISNSSFNNPELESCMLSIVRVLKFPATAGGVSVDVSYPFTFLNRSSH